jgi:FeS assembly protein IscX
LTITRAKDTLIVKILINKRSPHSSQSFILTQQNFQMGVRRLTGNDPELFWDATYAIAMALMDTYPDISPVDVGLNQLAELVQALPGFADEPAMATERMLIDIQLIWYEEAANL